MWEEVNSREDSNKEARVEEEDAEGADEAEEEESEGARLEGTISLEEVLLRSHAGTGLAGSQVCFFPSYFLKR